LGLAGQAEQSLVASDEAIARSQRNEENWYIAELLRVKGELSLQRGGKNAVAAPMKHFRLPLERSRQQGTLS
jgi:hypothetical protein